MWQRTIAAVMAKNIITMELKVHAAMAVAVENLDVVADADKNFVVVMKGRKINKNTTK